MLAARRRKACCHRQPWQSACKQTVCVRAATSTMTAPLTRGLVHLQDARAVAQHDSQTRSARAATMVTCCARGGQRHARWNVVTSTRTGKAAGRHPLATSDSQQQQRPMHTHAYACVSCTRHQAAAAAQPMVFPVVGRPTRAPCSCTPAHPPPTGCQKPCHCMT